MSMVAAIAPDLRETFIRSFQPRPACPVCGQASRSTYLRKFIRGIPLGFSRCLRCGLIYQDPMPSTDALKLYFNSHEFINDGRNTDDLRDTLGYYNYDAWDHSYRRTAAIRLGVIQRWAAPPARLLEIGTATGSFLHAAQRRGYQTRGLDISARFAEAAIRTYGLQIETGFIEEHPLPAASFDVVCAFGGIACWWDPLRALATIRRALRAGGVFVLNFSDVSSPPARLAGRSYPEINHASLVIYSRRTLRRLLRWAGFEICYDRTEWQYASVERIVTYWRSNLLRRMADAMGIAVWMLRVPAIGTRFVVCRPT
jgi:SAM-dependent methyltransferase